MDNSIDWIWNEVKKYQATRERQPAFPSDWDTDINNILYPSDIISAALEKTKKNNHLYLFSEDQTDSKETISKYLKAGTCMNVDASNIATSINSTNSLYLTLIALQKLNIKRFLIITPTYYTIIDTLEDLNCNITYLHLLDSDNFQIDLNKVESIISEQYIEAIVLTDPIYSTGIGINNKFYQELSSIVNRRGIWVVVDGTLGNMHWEPVNRQILDNSKIEAVIGIDKFVFIDSITKRFQVNGIKSSIVIAHNSLIPVIEDIACQVSGGFCGVQIELLNEFFNPENTGTLIKILEQNIKIITDSFNVLQTSLLDSGGIIYNSNNGPFSIIRSRTVKMNEADVKKVVHSFLYDCNLRILPLSSLCFYEQNFFGFRVNLLKKIKPLLPSINIAVRANFH